MVPWAMKIFRKWRCKREDRGETPLHIGISMEINEVNWCWVPTTWERLAIWWPHVTPCQVSQKRPFWTFWSAKSSKTTFLRKIRRGNRARPSFSKTSFLDFLAREKLKNDVFEKISSDDLVPMYWFVQKLSPVRSQHGLELATLKSDVVEKPSDFNLMTCLFRGV